MQTRVREAGTSVGEAVRRQRTSTQAACHFCCIAVSLRDRAFHVLFAAEARCQKIGGVPGRASALEASPRITYAERVVTKTMHLLPPAC